MNKYCIGIDFGTTNSSMAEMTAQMNEPREFEFKIGGSEQMTLLRTSLYFTGNEDGELIVKEAKATDDSSRFITSFKKLLIDNTEYVQLDNNKRFTVTELINRFLQEMLKQASIEVEQIERLVLSVPTSYTEAQKNVMENAAVQLGLSRNQVWFVDEPVAVLWNYHSNMENMAKDKDGKQRNPLPETLLVFDFGGGTLDLAVMRRSENLEDMDLSERKFRTQFMKHARTDRVGKVLVKQGVTVGGDNLDEVIMRFIFEQGQAQGNKVCEKLDLSLFDDAQRLIAFRQHPIYKNVKRLAEQVKIRLSNSREDSFTFSVPPLLNKHDLVGIPRITLTNDEFIARAAHLWDLVRSGMSKLEGSLKNKHGMDLTGIEAILLSGGSSKVPYVLDLLEEIAPTGRLIFDKHMQTSISRGNARYSANEKSEDGVIVEDIVNSAYGIYSHQHNTAKIVIEEDDMYPITVPKRLGTTTPNQRYIRIIPMVRKGDEAADFEPIRKNGYPVSFRMNIKPHPDALNYNRLKVEFTIDKSQKLKISAYDNIFKEMIGVEEVLLTELD